MQQLQLLVLLVLQRKETLGRIAVEDRDRITICRELIIITAFISLDDLY